jgi:hypothetical protein
MKRLQTRLRMNCGGKGGGTRERDIPLPRIVDGGKPLHCGIGILLALEWVRRCLECVERWPLAAHGAEGGYGS